MCSEDRSDDVELIAGLVDGEHLAAQHVDTGNGRCATCSAGRDAAGGMPWPCDGYRMAQRVIELQQRRRTR